MSQKSSAKQELLEILLKKFPTSRTLIESELNDFFSTKSKLTVKDLDQLEENLKKLTGWRREKRLNLSSLDRYPDTSQEKSSELTPFPSQSTSPYKLSLAKPTGKKIVERNKDNTIFPKDTFVNEAVHLAEHKKIKENDDWGKIVNADHLRYLSEERIRKVEKKKKQLSYREFLIGQIGNKTEDKGKNEDVREEEGWGEVQKKVFKEKEWLDQIMNRKREESEAKVKAKLREQQEMREFWAKQEENERIRQLKLRKIRETVAREQYLQATAKKHSKLIIKEYDRTLSKSLIEESVKRSKEVEMNKLEVVSKRLQFVHDDSRLQRLVTPMQLPHCSSPNDSNASVDFLNKLFESQSPKIRNPKYLKELENQIQEKKNRELEYIKLQREQGHIWAEQDQKAFEADQHKKLTRKLTQNSLRAEYDSKVAEKQKKHQNRLQLSPSEAEMNKNLFQSSLALLSLSPHKVLN